MVSLLAAFVAGFLVFLFRTNILSNPLKDVEPENSILSTLVGTINNLFGSNPSSHEDEDESVEEKFAKSGYPAELFSFDVTSQPAVFGIVDVNQVEKTMVLSYILPFDRQGKVIESIINCSIEESMITYLNQEDQSQETVQAKKPLYEIADTDTGTMLGICGDNECNSIESSCELQRAK